MTPIKRLMGWGIPVTVWNWLLVELMKMVSHPARLHAFRSMYARAQKKPLAWGGREGGVTYKLLKVLNDRWIYLIQLSFKCFMF